MLARLLPVEERRALKGTPLDGLVIHPNAEVYVVEDEGGQVIGCWALLQAWHADGIWIHPDHRGKAGVGRELLACLSASGIAKQIPAVWTTIETPGVEELAEKFGATRIPGAHFLLPVGGRS